MPSQKRQGGELNKMKKPGNDTKGNLNCVYYIDTKGGKIAYFTVIAFLYRLYKVTFSIKIVLE